MAKKSCCVPGCLDKSSTRHRIPIRNEFIYDEWLRRIGNAKLFTEDKDKVNRNYVICRSHFIDECTNHSSVHLKIYSLPSVNLPGMWK